MASVRTRVNSAGETVTQVLYRHGGKQASKTFKDPKKAERFKGLVDLLGPDKALVELFGGDRPNRLTVGELADKFLEWKADGTKKVTPRTLTDYRRDIDNYVRPWFGHLPADAVDEVAVQKWVDHMAKKLSPKSVADRHMLLHSMYDFGTARTRRLVEHNPCKETELPAPAKKRAKGTKVAEWRRILDVAAERNPDAHDLILFLGTVGWRFSEGIALPAGNVEEDGDGRLWVDMSQVFRMVDNRQVLMPEAAKSFAGFRRVPVPSKECAAMLRRRVVGKGPNDLVFTNVRGNHWNQWTFLRDTWPGILKKAGLYKGPGESPTPHWLRHMAVAVLAAAGASAADIQRYVGHEDVSTTLGTYGGMIGGLSGDVLANADRILAGHGPKGLVVVGEVVDDATAAVAEIVAGEVQSSSSG